MAGLFIPDFMNTTKAVDLAMADLNVKPTTGETSRGITNAKSSLTEKIPAVWDAIVASAGTFVRDYDEVRPGGLRIYAVSFTSPAPAPNKNLFRLYRTIDGGTSWTSSGDRASSPDGDSLRQKIKLL